MKYCLLIVLVTIVWSSSIADENMGAWLKAQKIKTFCGIGLGAKDPDNHRNLSEFLEGVSGNIRFKSNYYSYDLKQKVIVFDKGTLGSYGFFAKPFDPDIEIDVLITPVSHLVAAIHLTGRKVSFEYFKKTISFVSQDEIEMILDNSIGRGKELFCKDGWIDIGNNAQHIYFNTNDNGCTEVTVVDDQIMKTVENEGRKFVEQISKQAEDDQKSVIKRYCGVPFGNAIDEDVEMNRSQGEWDKLSCHLSLLQNL